MKRFKNWHQELAESVASVDQLLSLGLLSSVEVSEVISRYPFRVTPYYLSLIKSSNDPVWRQCVPDPAELDDSQSEDPLDEENLSPVPNLIHRYPDRAVWLVSNRCAVYCRFCMRKRRVGILCGNISEAFDQAISYISEHKELKDIILSGGDPFLLEDEEIEAILSSLRNIPHVEIIRIGTRAPVTLPSRITSELCEILKKYHPIYINTHFNHPLEITVESSLACRMLADSGIPIGNQTVLLKGVNDDTEVIKDLFRKLLTIRVKPYYLHQMDLVKGTSHFRTPLSVGLNIIKSIRGHVSGMCVPHFVVDLPGGKGKVPLIPDPTVVLDELVEFRNYLGESIEYKDLVL